VFCCDSVGTIGVVSQSREVDHAIGGKPRDLAADEAIGALAGRQHGVVGRSQLLAAGVGARAIEHRIATRRLHPLYRGVYAVGHLVLSHRARWMAATLATGGVLSHRSAAALWGLRAWNGRIELTIPWSKSERPGLLLHRAVLPPDEITTHHGIPTTTPARTLLDLAAVLDRTALQRAINEAEVLRLPGPHRLAERHPTKKGTKALRALAPPAHTRLELEARFHAFLHDRRFPPPQTNTLIEGHEVDAAWPDRKLIVELDSWTFHGTREAFETDRRRDRHLTARGWTVVRVTWRDLDDPDTLERELRALGL
jgi:very-short-patch-repair endonuclease